MAVIFADHEHWFAVQSAIPLRFATTSSGVKALSWISTEASDPVSFGVLLLTTTDLTSYDCYFFSLHWIKWIQYLQYIRGQKQ